MTVVGMTAPSQADTLQEDTEVVLNVGRRMRRWLSQHRLTIVWAFFALGALLFSVWYLGLLYSYLSFLWATAPYLYWTVLGVNGLALTFLVAIIWRVSLAEVPVEVQ